jgi:RND superfamily putative drug exporter
MVGLVLTLVLVPFSYHVESRLETAVHIKGGEAEAVDRELAEDFKSPYVHRVVLVVQGIPKGDLAGGAKVLGLIATTLRADPGVSGVLSRLDWDDTLFRGTGGGTLIIIGLESRDRSIEALIPKLRESVYSLQRQLRGQFPQLELELTGETPLNFDLRKVSADDVNRAEMRVLPVTLILLLLAFGSLVAAMLPLGVGVLAISMTMGAAALLAHQLHLSILVQNLATMLGLGLGIDYALLMVSRFREALEKGYDSGTAADIAASHAGHVLIISASTVAIGFAALLTVPISELSSIGIAGLLVAAMSVLLATSVLPWILALLGHRINALNIRFATRLGNAGASMAELDLRWRRWGMTVTARPWTALLLAGIPLLLLAWQSRQLSVGFPPGDWLPKGAESVQALHSLDDMGRAGIVQSLRLLLELPPEAPATSQAGWTAVSALTKRLAGDPRAAQVISLPSLTGMANGATVIGFVPEPSRRSFLRSDGRVALLEVLPARGVSSGEQIQWVRDLRSANVAALTGLPGTALRVGGIPGINADYDEVVRKRLPKVMELVVGGSFIALLLGLRSVFAAVKAIALNLLSVGAAFGALVLVFQQGHGGRLFGVAGGTGAVFPIVPILSFAIVFGLSMDYEVFLVARVLEERRRGLSERAAVVEGLATTARLITSAAAIMVVVFAAFTLGNFLIIKMLGFTLAVAVIIDATLVRMVIGPALLCLAGDWNWWPWGLYGSAAMPEAKAEK